ncbi:Transposase OS=Azospirillum sp. (strain B510) GN=AZL_b01240 PE=4 SV=1 [Gemmata massiliana]|uniref:Transposase n=1 Tax=Gemmata massiliana TaxID=1210884 RepID=A0A6P2D9F1_9BACT|nr:transposase [Gemmata massiliana]VTR97809.1 Transposase OS=Azospirillum sp. (strain B510) GN=AZL_b01240 PE=4 SV=1 [Gemmata massiliana]
MPTAPARSELPPRIGVWAQEAVLREWIAIRLSPEDPLVVNVDGTCARGSASAQRPGVYLPAACAPRVSAILTQLRVDAKTNEHKAALELLNVLPPRRGGYITTGDAMFTQTEVCRAIRDRNDDYGRVLLDHRHALAVDIDAGLTFAAQAATFSPEGAFPKRAHVRSAVRTDG